MDDIAQSIRLTGVMANVRKACAFVVQAVEAAGGTDNTRFHCELSVDEIFTNIVEHGYGENSDDQYVEIEVSNLGDCVQITIADDAPAFNPLSQSPPTLRRIMDDDHVGGGWGLSFVRKNMDHIHYHYHDGRNFLILTHGLP